MLPLSLVTGFLGSGKTTLLTNFARDAAAGPLLFLVNEFAANDVDGTRLQAKSADVVTLPGGSIFCRCLVTEFIGTLKELSRKATSAERPYRGLVVEASGMANPKVIRRMLVESQLHEDFQLASIITVVEPAAVEKLLVTLPNITEQIEAADAILINKVDCYEPETVDRVEERLRTLNPSAALFRTIQAEVSLDPFTLQPIERSFSGDYAPCRDPRYDVLEVDLTAPVDIGRLRLAILDHRESLYRIKGTVRATTGVLDLDFSASGFSTQPTVSSPSMKETPHLVFIFPGSALETVRNQLVRPLAAGEFGFGGSK